MTDRNQRSIIDCLNFMPLATIMTSVDLKYKEYIEKEVIVDVNMVEIVSLGIYV